MVSRPLWQGNLSFEGEYTYTDRINNYVNEQGILNDDHSNIREDAVSAFVEYARRFGQVYVMSTWFLITTKTVSVSMNKAVRTTMCSLPFRLQCLWERRNFRSAILRRVSTKVQVPDRSSGAGCDFKFVSF